MDTQVIVERRFSNIDHPIIHRPSKQESSNYDARAFFIFGALIPNRLWKNTFAA
jgi:hypothetical protein